MRIYYTRDDGGTEDFFATATAALRHRDKLIEQAEDVCAYTVELEDENLKRSFVEFLNRSLSFVEDEL